MALTPVGVHLEGLMRWLMNHPKSPGTVSAIHASKQWSLEQMRKKGPKFGTRKVNFTSLSQHNFLNIDIEDF